MKKKVDEDWIRSAGGHSQKLNLLIRFTLGFQRSLAALKMVSYWDDDCQWTMFHVQLPCGVHLVRLRIHFQHEERRSTNDLSWSLSQGWSVQWQRTARTLQT